MDSLTGSFVSVAISRTIASQTCHCNRTLCNGVVPEGVAIVLVLDDRRGFDGPPSASPRSGRGHDGRIMSDWNVGSLFVSYHQRSSSTPFHARFRAAANVGTLPSTPHVVHEIEVVARGHIVHIDDDGAWRCILETSNGHNVQTKPLLSIFGRSGLHGQAMTWYGRRPPSCPAPPVSGGMFTQWVAAGSSCAHCTVLWRPIVGRIPGAPSGPCTTARSSPPCIAVATPPRFVSNATPPAETEPRS